MKYRLIAGLALALAMNAGGTREARPQFLIFNDAIRAPYVWDYPGQHYYFTEKHFFGNGPRDRSLCVTRSELKRRLEDRRLNSAVRRLGAAFCDSSAFTSFFARETRADAKLSREAAKLCRETIGRAWIWRWIWRMSPEMSPEMRQALLQAERARREHVDELPPNARAAAVLCREADAISYEHGIDPFDPYFRLVMVISPEKRQAIRQADNLRKEAKRLGHPCICGMSYSERQVGPR